MLRSPLQQRALQLTRGMRPASSVLTALRFGCKMENGQRIYTSDSPSILHDLQKENHVLDFLMKRIDRFDPSRVSVIQGDTGESLTLGQLKELVESVAGLYYHACGLRQGDVVCLSLPNHYYYPALAYGAMRCGAAVSTVNPLSDVDTLAYYLECTKAKVLVGCHLFRPVLEATVSRLHRDGKEVKLLFLEDIVREGSFTPVPADYRPIEKATLDDTVYIPFSSGTTGLPKGVQLTNRNLIAASLQCFEHFQFTSEMTSLSILPYFHAYGFNGNMTTILATGSRQVVLSKYSLDTMLDYIQRYKVTFSCIAPPILLSLLRNAEKVRQYDISSLASLHCGAAALSHTTQKAFEATFPTVRCVLGYGLTETSPTGNHVRPLTTPKPLGSVGGLFPDMEMRIVKVDDSQQSGADKSTGVDAEEGGQGEIWYRGPNIMKGYLKQEDTDKCMQDGWFRTGDIGRVDPKTSNLYITDRLKELIKYKGFQVSPTQLEQVLLDHPWVEDCVVVGVHDPRDENFEVPRASVVLKPNVAPADLLNANDNIQNYVMARVAPYQRLHGGLRIVKDIPKNASGKLLRRVARADEEEYLKESMKRIGL